MDGGWVSTLVIKAASWRGTGFLRRFSSSIVQIDVGNCAWTNLTAIRKTPTSSLAGKVFELTLPLEQMAEGYRA
jgi:hypothetical protein